ncbi:MAG: methyltransferase domain-containing protein [Hydrogenophaga sp.]|uniref:class I SAM-dependent methyltransferase n=1 Tax=Hydrogenophaga sp. TaxID=1904254 RepID=UPI0016A6C506|nr:methyltransferase domain-containing protein [Hydrogenophaga sp.]NIM39666.1 methyltransferase domain-containing protein [Hydrogenophaga sp.]NIN24870.1 methyltransferase domain-containing protein [Hydrogenophaga sp.]NIN29382.1 methyltransferase domain-containing protein [Hydrogenophaga sp.]NIN53905.1 methyltransferase domain-containing protein [Hydrogenophaga sp.]NIO50109.1 methyltransferase domain-containing protein [Hydrogenophaga sp.]
MTETLVSSPAPAVFDAEKFRQTTRAQWESAAPAWDRWGPLLARWLGPATEAMLDMAAVGEGSRVLDVAAGAGEQTLTAARRVGARGHVLATDISPAILRYAKAAADAAGLSHVETLELDGERHDRLPAGSFDAAVSRVGLIYFPDQQRALAGIRHALKPGGRFAAVVYATADRNAFFSVPVGIIRRRAQLPPPLPGQPGPFSLGGEGVLARALEQAGFRDVEVRRIDSPVHLPTAAECVRFERESFGALHQMMASLSEAERDDTWREIEQALLRFESPAAGFVGPCEMLVGAGTR